MNVLYLGFKGKNNASATLLDQKEDSKFYLTNSYNSIQKEISFLDLSSYDKIYIFGIKKELKDEILIESHAKNDFDIVNTNLNIKDYKKYFIEKGIKCELNNKPTNYLCNFAYYQVLQKNRNCLLFHIPGMSKIHNWSYLASVFLNMNIK